MARLNSQGYIERKNGACWQSWWLVKYNKIIPIKHIKLPENLTGKKVRLKLEIIEE